MAARDDMLRAQGVKKGLARARSARVRGKHRYVFVVTYGRSGSTLLQGVLNTLPRTLVRGENGLYLLDLYRAQAALTAFRESHDKHVRPTPESAFFGLKDIRPAAFTSSMHELVTDAIFGQTDPTSWDVIGFKEVAWHRVEPEEMAEFFDAMDRAFPNALYLLNTRDHDAVVGSGFWKRVEEDEARRLIDRVVTIQEHLRATRPDRSLDVRYELLTSDDESERDACLRRIGAFVTGNEVTDELAVALNETTARRHGPNPTRS